MSVERYPDVVDIVFRDMDAVSSVVSFEADKAVDLKKSRNALKKLRVLGPILLLLGMSKNKQKVLTKTKTQRKIVRRNCVNGDIKFEVTKRASIWETLLRLSRSLRHLVPVVSKKSKTILEKPDNGVRKSGWNSFEFSSSSLCTNDYINDERTNSMGSKRSRLGKLLGRAKSAPSLSLPPLPPAFEVCDKEGNELFPIDHIFEEVRRKNDAMKKQRASSDPDCLLDILEEEQFDAESADSGWSDNKKELF